jgi:tetratricopeptide (TPR) repeat protein
MQERCILEARANLQRSSGLFEDSVRTWETIRERLHAVGDVGEERVATVCLSECEFQRGENARAIELIENLLPSARTAADWGLTARALCDLAAYHIAMGALAQAREPAEEALRLVYARDTSSPHLLTALEIMAVLILRSGEYERAARIALFTQPADRTSSSCRGYVAMSIHDRLERELAAANTQSANGVALNLADVVRSALG